MKMLFTLIAAVLLSSAALADETLVRWNVLSALSNSGMLDNADVRKSLTNADVESAKPTQALKDAVCSNRTVYENDPIKLADALQTRITAIKKIQAAELVRLDAKLLETGQKAEVDAKVTNISIHTIDKTDEWVQNVRTGVFTTGPLIEQICKEAAK